MKALVVVALLFVAAASAAHAEDRVAVMRLDGLGVDDVTLDKLDHGVRQQLTKLGVAMATHEETAAALAKAAKPGKASCEGDLACLLAVGRALKTTAVITGTAGLAADELRTTLRLIDTGLGMEKKSVDAVGPVDQAERKVREAVMKLVAPDRYNTSGAIALTLDLTGAEIVVDGVPRGITPLFGPIDGLAPGRREVEVRYAGKRSFRGFVDVAFEDSYALDLADKDGALVQVPHTTAPSTGPAVTPGEGGIPVLTLVGAGVGVVGVGLLIGSGVAYSAAEADFEQFHDKGDVSKSLADHNFSMRVAYGMLLGSGVALVITGGALAVVPLLE